MYYSKFVTSLSKSFFVDPRLVMFACLCVAGCSDKEAYAHIYRQVHLSDDSLAQKVNEFRKAEPKLNKVVKAIEQIVCSRLGESCSTGNNSDIHLVVDEDNASGWDDKLSDTENLEKIIKEEIPKLEGKDKISAAQNYVKLRGVEVGKVERVYFYLPLKCSCCNWFKDREIKGDG